MEHLSGIELISCAKSLASHGLHEAAQQCGYGEDTQFFMNELKKAGDELGISIASIDDLVTDQEAVIQLGGIEVAPDSGSQL